MVKIKDIPHILPDGTINLDAWLQHTAKIRNAQDSDLLKHASVLAQLTGGENKPTLTGVSCLQQGLTMAEILWDLHLDTETIAAAIVYSSVNDGDLSLDDVREHLGEKVADLVRGTIQMKAMRTIPKLSEDDHGQLENVRKMLLAMVEDMRVVIIKLAERTTIMRNLTLFDPDTCRQIAQETMEIYAPLANRLGLTSLKWELEDLSFRYLDPAHYREIAVKLNETRLVREHYVHNIVAQLEQALKKTTIKNLEISGRVKHIYSAYRKMLRKKIPFEQLFDLNAVRILVETVEDCYTALSIIQNLWQNIPSEFDDYIATPKANGYRSIHTVIKGPENKNVEIQIRTHDMHKESEHGLAAHWQYKEGKQQKAGYQAKIAWLRQVLAWQKELVKTGDTSGNLHQHHSLDDFIYVFTPAGQIIELPQGATPLDFAYHIHSEIGHRCRGAKVNGHLVQLTHTLNTGEQIEILTSKHPNPSRDWLNNHLGYLKTARAKAKVHHWFKLLDYDKNVIDGQASFERECHRLAIADVDIEKIATKLHFKNKKDMFAAVGAGMLRLSNILHTIQSQLELHKKTAKGADDTIIVRAPTRKRTSSGIHIAGVGNLLTQTAPCCKPVPGDSITGFVTKGRGVAIHRQDCQNILNIAEKSRNRLIEVSWGDENKDIYPVDLEIEAYDRSGLIRDISTLIANEKLNLLSITFSLNKLTHVAFIALTVEITGLNSLSHLLDRIKQIPNVVEVGRSHTKGVP